MLGAGRSDESSWKRGGSVYSATYRRVSTPGLLLHPIAVSNSGAADYRIST